jgi:hypothetical protein
MLIGTFMYINSPLGSLCSPSRSSFSKWLLEFTSLPLVPCLLPRSTLDILELVSCSHSRCASHVTPLVSPTLPRFPLARGLPYPFLTSLTPYLLVRITPLNSPFTPPPRVFRTFPSHRQYTASNCPVSANLINIQYQIIGRGR